jgi:hypothetical protein
VRKLDSGVLNENAGLRAVPTPISLACPICARRPITSVGIRLREPSLIWEDVDKGRIANAATEREKHEDIEVTPEMVAMDVAEPDECQYWTLLKAGFERRGGYCCLSRNEESCASARLMALSARLISWIIAFILASGNVSPTIFPGAVSFLSDIAIG